MMRQNPRIQGQDRGCELEPHEWRSKAPHAHAPLYRGAPLYFLPRRQRRHHFRDTEPRNILLNLQLHREIYKDEPQAAEHNNSNNNTKKTSFIWITISVSTTLFWLLNCAPLGWRDLFSESSFDRAHSPPPPKKKLQLYNYHRNDKSSLKISCSFFFFFFFQPDSSGRMKWMLEWFSPRSQSDHGCEAAVFKGKSQLKSR